MRAAGRRRVGIEPAAPASTSRPQSQQGRATGDRTSRGGSTPIAETGSPNTDTASLGTEVIVPAVAPRSEPEAPMAQPQREERQRAKAGLPLSAHSNISSDRPTTETKTPGRCS